MASVCLMDVDSKIIKEKKMNEKIQFDGITRITIESQELVEKLVSMIEPTSASTMVENVSEYEFDKEDKSKEERVLDNEGELEGESGGVRVGLRPGELRVTCVLSDIQNDLLHAWSATSGRTFRQVTMAMADFYIENVIGMAVRDGVKLKRSEGKEPPVDYSEWYESEFNDPYAEFFK